jgi:hypothetical protein
LTDKLNRKTINIGDVHLFGSGKEVETTPLLSNWIRHSRFRDWKVVTLRKFKRLDFNGIIYHSRSSDAGTRFCSHAVLLSDETYAIIKRFLCVTFEKRTTEVVTLAIVEKMKFDPKLNWKENSIPHGGATYKNGIETVVDISNFISKVILIERKNKLLFF